MQNLITKCTLQSVQRSKIKTINGVVHMEMKEDIVIVGAGLAGLTTSLALHRLGLRSLVLESSESLRVTGFALTLWSNAWRALDALGIAQLLRHRSTQISGFNIASQGISLPFTDLGLDASIKSQVECRCVKRKELLELLENELPQGTIRYSSKVVSIEESEQLKLVHLADGTVIQTKVLIGCDGVKSHVAKWLGLQKPVHSGRSAIRGLVQYPEGHGFKPLAHVYFNDGVRYGFVPCDDKNVYWFSTFPSSSTHEDEEIVQNPFKMKQFVLSKIGDGATEVSDIVERTELQFISCAKLKLRLPWNILLGNIVKSNVCVAGDALHPMTPDLGQGGSSALEDSVVLARCLAEALLTNQRVDNKDRKVDGDEYEKMKSGLEKYAKQRRWRSFSLVSAAYLVGFVQESNGEVMSFLKEKFLSKYSTRSIMKMADYDCGKLIIS